MLIRVHPWLISTASLAVPGGLREMPIYPALLRLSVRRNPVGANRQPMFREFAGERFGEETGAGAENDDQEGEEGHCLHDVTPSFGFTCLRFWRGWFYLLRFALPRLVLVALPPVVSHDPITGEADTDRLTKVPDEAPIMDFLAMKTGHRPLCVGRGPKRPNGRRPRRGRASFHNFYSHSKYALPVPVHLKILRKPRIS